MAHDIALATIDEWCFAVRLPCGSQKLRKTFFADRIVQSGKPDTKHIKAFAAEMLTAIMLMGLFLGHRHSAFWDSWGTCGLLEDVSCNYISIASGRHLAHK